MESWSFILFCTNYPGTIDCHFMLPQWSHLLKPLIFSLLSSGLRVFIEVSGRHFETRMVAHKQREPFMF